VTPRRSPPARKKRSRYHHGDLRRALLNEAVRTIQSDGIDALTLRGVGARLGVSRTALYRHFTDKSALLAAVAAEGFRALREALVSAVERAADPAAGFKDQGRAYVRFAVQNPAHYRVMFGRSWGVRSEESEVVREGAAAFEALVALLVTLQAQGIARQGDPVQLARFIWASVHGVAMLALDGQWEHQHTDLDVLVDFVVERIAAAIRP
jgi:AcrR family transcriptional regulator